MLSAANVLDQGVWHRSDKLVLVSDGEAHVVYNRLLNSPVWIDKEGYDFIQNNETLSSVVRSELDGAFAEALLLNHIYFLEGVREEALINAGVSKHLESASKGEFTTFLDLRISSACNFGCEHCIAATAKTGAIMSFQQAKDIVDTYVDFLSVHDHQTIDIHFGIAEPLLAYRQIEEIIHYVEVTYPDYAHVFSINTNLSLLNEHQAAFFRDHNVYLHVSIDGLEKTNDLIRTYKDGTGTFADIVRKIRLLKECGYPVPDIGVTLTNRNYHAFKVEISEFIQWLKEYGIREVACEFDLINSTDISTNEKIFFLLDLIDKMEAAGIAVDGTWGIPFRNLTNASYADSAFAFCRGASGNNLSVDGNGDVYMCSCSSKKICSLRDFDVALRPGGAFFDFVKKNLLTMKPECWNCPIAGCCIGQCAVTREYHPQADGKTREQCDFYINVTKALLLREARHIREEVST